MLEYMPYIWAIVTVAAVVVESMTSDLVTIWFIPSGLIAAIVSLLPFRIEIWVQVFIFFVTALILVVMSKTIFKEFFKKKPIVPTNLDAVIGQDAVVTESINNIEGKGAVKVLGKEWSALTSNDGETIEKGSLVTVLEIRGVKLICKKK